MAEGREARDERFPKGAKCENCVEEDLAIAYCQVCKLLLCDECDHHHKKQKQTSSHKLVVSERADEIRSRFMCKAHKRQPLNYYCSECDKPICDHCCKKTEACRGHRILVADDVHQEVNELLTKVRDKKREYEGYVEYVRSVSEKNQTAMVMCEGEIERGFETAVRELENWKTDILRQLQEVSTRNSQLVATQKQQIEKQLGSLETSLQSAECLLESEKDSKLMVGRQQLLANLKGVAAYEWSVEHARPRGWQLKAKPARAYAREFASLIAKPNAVDMIVKGLEEAPRIGRTNSFTVILKQHTADDLIANSEVDIQITLTPDRSESIVVAHRAKRENHGNVWIVTYFLRMGGLLKVSISACGIPAQDSPFTVAVRETEELAKGTRVVRGPDWKWGGQDGGEGSKGEVVAVKEGGWVMIKWDNNKHKAFDYRWGAQGCFDLAVS